jgi:hypothetical protein
VPGGNAARVPGVPRVAWLEDVAITVTMRAVPSPDEGLWVALKDDAHTVVGSGKTFAYGSARASVMRWRYARLACHLWWRSFGV